MLRMPEIEVRLKVLRQIYSGTHQTAKTKDGEGAIRMILNNIHPDVAEDWKNLIIYGGGGKAARNWECLFRIIEILQALEVDETLLVQSGKPVYVAKTHRGAPRIIIANSNIVPAWATQKNFDKYDAMGLTMYGQMTAGSWIYIGMQGILQGTYETFAALAKKHFYTDCLQDSLGMKIVVSAGLGGMGSAQPLAIKMNRGVGIIIEVDQKKAIRLIEKGWCDQITHNLTHAITLALEARENKEPQSIALIGNAAEILPQMLQEDFIPNIITDQTSAHNLGTYVPIGNFDQIIALKKVNEKEYRRKSQEAIITHCKAIIEMQKQGAIAFDYGNNLRGQAETGGLKVRDDSGKFLYPGFVPEYIRPLFCEGKGPFRWAALSGNPHDIEILDEAVLELFPKDKALARWIHCASKKDLFQGLPARVCWLGYGDRAKFGLKINELVRKTFGGLKGPIAIGRDHLDCGSVASPNRETEDMIDGSDAIGDWPLLGFALNALCGASWVSFHHGGGVGIGNSLHNGVVIIADGSKEKDEVLKIVLNNDPGMGIARHADAGYEKAVKMAKKFKIKIPGLK